MPERLRDLFEAAGARWLDLPVLHPADAFLETAGEDVRRRMFVTEARSGEELALRPDFTIPACLRHLGEGAGPARYAYGGPVFRRHDHGATERLETGFEDLGDTDRAGADARAVTLAAAGVERLGRAGWPEPHGVRIGATALFVALTVALGLPEPWRRRLRHAFGNPAMIARDIARLSTPPEAAAPGDPELARAAAAHDPGALAAFLESRQAAHGLLPGVGRRADEIAGRFLDRLALAETRLAPEAAEALSAYLALDLPLSEAVAALRDFAGERGLDLGPAIDGFALRADALGAARLPLPLRFEGGFGRPLDYYTGLVFEIVDGEGRPRAGGGRYDRLLELLGSDRPVPAVGFSITLDEDGR